MELMEDKRSFWKHVFHFDEEGKADVMNLVQYAFLAIIPVVVLNKMVGRYIPEADDSKGSVELVAEVLIQILVTFLGLFMIHRLVTFVPTQSGNKYPNVSIVTVVLALLMIMTSFQTKLGEKVSILVDRAWELWNGQKPSTKAGMRGRMNGGGAAGGSGAGGAATGAGGPGMGGGAGGSGAGTAIHSLPNIATVGGGGFDHMHRPDTNPMVGAHTPGMSGAGAGGMVRDGFTVEPMAANEMLGSGPFGGW